MRKKILLTGCAGFIGSNFVKNICTRKDVTDNYDFFIIDSLTYAGHYPNIKDEIETQKNLTFERIDIRDQTLINELFQQQKFDGVMNFAAESHVDRSIENPNVFAETNIMGTMNLLNASLPLKKNNPDFVYLQVSTDEVYGQLNETDPPFSETTPIAPSSPYSASKASADHFVQAYHHTFGLSTIITRCSNNYGPYQFTEKFIPVLISRALKDEPLPIYGNGRNIRDWIYVDDHNEGVWVAFLKGRPGRVYNFGGDCEKRNIDVAKAILKQLNKPMDLLQFVKDRPGHDFRYAMEFNLATKELNWTPKVTFEQGIDKTIQWYKNFPDYFHSKNT